MHNHHSADSLQKSVEGLQPDEPATVDATGPYVSSTATESERKRIQPLPNAPTIPGYVITGIIAKGGMGVVYAALDLKFDREVAIKILLPGGDAGRFVTEAKITARLPHPAIPPVYDLGELGDGSHYLVMKLIRGQTLQALLPGPARGSGAVGEGIVDRSRLIQIFEQIAQAVGFAHSRGIIHRDLKPLNVMVGEFGEVQVMDWGLAKDVHGPSSTVNREELAQTREDGHRTTDAGQHTAVGTIMGTPSYMAPEQARGEVVDARADVFALGSILAALLTGQPAFVGATLRERVEKAASADLAEVFARLDASGADDDLLALCKRCLSAKAEDRPENGQAVAKVAAAYRAGVEARLRQAETDRARAVTQAAEQRKRRRVWIGLAATLLLGLIATLALSAWAVRAERVASAERDAKDVALEAATLAEQQAADRLSQIESINESVFDIFSDVDIRKVKNGPNPLEYVLADRLILAGRKLDDKTIHDPLMRARLRHRLGRTLLSLGRARDAIPFLKEACTIREAALGADDLDALQSMNDLATAHQAAGELDTALPLLEESYNRLRTAFGPEHANTLTAMSNLAAGYEAAGQLERALPLWTEALRLQRATRGHDHPDTLTTLNNLAMGYYSAGQYDKSAELHEEALELLRNALPLDHPDTLISMNNLALAYEHAGRREKALELYEEALRHMKSRLGPDHPATLTTMNNLAMVYSEKGQSDKALPLLEQCLQLRKTRLGVDHPDTLQSMNNLALTYNETGQTDKAIPLLEETLQLRKRRLGADHPDTFTSMNNLALGYRAVGRMDAALPLWQETLELRRSKLGVDHPDTVTSMSNLAAAFRALGRSEEALPLFEEAARGVEKGHFRHEHAQGIISHTVRAYEAGKQPEQAQNWRRKWLMHVKESAGAESPAYADVLGVWGMRQLQLKKWAEAESALRDCLAILEKTQPNGWMTSYVRSMLGGALLGQNKYDAAEPLLVKGYEEMSAHGERSRGADTAGSPPPKLIVESLDRLIELYRAIEKPEEVKKWQAEKEKLQAAPTSGER